MPQGKALAAAFRNTMAAVCTPVSVVTALDGHLPHGTTVSAFASLSMDPPMVLVALARTSDLLTVIRTSRSFAVNILSRDQSALALRFARKGGTGKFAGLPWDLCAGVPRIPGAGGFLGCRVADLVPGGDHIIVLGDVVAAETAAGAPLTYHARAFGTHAAAATSSSRRPA